MFYFILYFIILINMTSQFNINVHNGLTFSNDNSTLSVAAVSGTDTAGKNLTIAAGQGTGTGAGGNIVFQTADGDGGTGSNANSLVTAMTILDDGNVGIGTTNPTSKLHIIGDDIFGPGGITVVHSEGTSGTFLGYGGISSINTNRLRLGVNKNEKMMITNSGYVGIGTGTTEPTKGALHVEHALSVSADATGDGYLTGGGSVGTWSGHAGLVSIYSRWRLWAEDTIIASSDSRIKTNIEELVDDEALIKFRQLKPCKYNYIDVFQRGNDQVYGFLADEVKTILSNAVSTCNNHIPNVYKSALYNNNTITFQEPHNLDTDGNIQLYLPDNTKILVPYTVGDTLKINIDVSNLSDNENPSNDLVEDEDGNYLENNIFVYGTEVDDFHRLDKSAIWTTGVAALQEVDRQLQAEKAKTATLETQVADLLARVTALENP